MMSGKPFVLHSGLEVDIRVRSALVSDSLDLIGIRSNVMSRAVTPLVSAMKIIGYASTIEFVEEKDFDPQDPYGPAIDFLDSLQSGDVAIVATGHSTQSAFWGELFSTAAKGRGANGVVTDGPLRDTQEILPVGFSAFGIGTLPFDYKGRMKVSSVHSRVSCGGVEVNQGDLIVADNDGVAVVPASKIDEVITLANERARRESTVLKELLEGKSVRSVWDKHRVL
jgi:4-hydroxy-4-methyl-2-oxoglutarate aldolase